MSERSTSSSIAKWNPHIKTRMILLFYLTLACFFGLGWRLVKIQSTEAADLRQKALNQHIGVLPVTALRGSILDTNGSVLATSVALPSIAANPKEIATGDVADTAYRLAEILNMPTKDVISLIRGKGTFVWLQRKVKKDVVERITKADPPLKGVFVVHESTGKRFYPKGRLAVHIVGYAGIDDDGLDGIEGHFDHFLKGEDGRLEAEMDRDGTVIPGGWSKLEPARPGHSVVLTIDETIQYIVERELEKALRRHQARNVTCIVMDVKTGDILAMASKPDFDPARFGKASTFQRRNRAVSDTYEPGSTFKVFLAAAALDCGKISPSNRFFAGRHIVVDGWTIGNAADGLYSLTGTETVKGMLTYSFNTAAGAIGLSMGRRTLGTYLEKFGFGQHTGVTLPGEAEGLMSKYTDWANVNVATISFGQGISVTPLQLTCAMQGICNMGVQLKPRLVKAILDSKGHVIKTYPVSVHARTIKPETALLMRDCMRAVVTEGTAKKAELPGFYPMGKTGTANVVENGIYVSGKYIASFIGALPMQDPRVVILVKVDQPKGTYWGGTVAAPLFHDIAADVVRHLGVQPLPYKPPAEPTSAH